MDVETRWVSEGESEGECENMIVLLMSNADDDDDYKHEI